MIDVARHSRNKELIFATESTENTEKDRDCRVAEFILSIAEGLLAMTEKKEDTVLLHSDFLVV